MSILKPPQRRNKVETSVEKVIECLYHTKERVAIYYGDRVTGNHWGDIVYGRVSRSTGTKPVYILVHNKRSSGGPAILIRDIVRIETSRGGELVYAHPPYYPALGKKTGKKSTTKN